MKYTSSDIVNTLLVDDHPLIRKGMRTLLNTLPFNFSIDEASNGLEAIEGADRKNYHLIVLDIQMKEMNGVEVARFIKRKYPETKIIALTFISNKRTMIEMLEIGVEGYILKDIEIKDLKNAIEIVMDGNIYLTPEVNAEWSAYLMNKAKGVIMSYNDNLSEREIEIIKLICLQKTSEQIAELLFLSKATVNNHRAHVMKKTKSENVVALIVYAIRHNYFNPEELKL